MNDVCRYGLQRASEIRSADEKLVWKGAHSKRRNSTTKNAKYHYMAFAESVWATLATLQHTALQCAVIRWGWANTGEFLRRLGWMPVKQLQHSTPFTASLTQSVSDRLPHNLRGGFAAHIGREVFGLGEDFLNPALDGARGFGFTKVGQHHGGRPDLADRIGDAFSGDVRSRAMHGLKHGGILFRRIQVRAGSNADRAHHRGAQVGKDVAKQVRSHDHVKHLRAAHEMRGENVDVILIGADVRIFLGNCGKALVPVRH